jgi:hypothetical protein
MTNLSDTGCAQSGLQCIQKKYCYNIIVLHCSILFHFFKYRSSHKIETELQWSHHTKKRGGHRHEIDPVSLDCYSLHREADWYQHAIYHLIVSNKSHAYVHMRAQHEGASKEYQANTSYLGAEFGNYACSMHAGKTYLSWRLAVMCCPNYFGTDGSP